jgi:hypothetical protein
MDKSVVAFLMSGKNNRAAMIVGERPRRLADQEI